MKIYSSLLALILIGCVTPPKPITQSRLANIEAGRTTEAEARAMLGTPSSVRTVDGPDGRQTVLTYASRYLTPTRGNYWNATLGALAGDPTLGQTDEQVVSLYIDANGIVESVDVTQGGLPPPEPKAAKPVRVGKTVEGD